MTTREHDFVMDFTEHEICEHGFVYVNDCPACIDAVSVKHNIPPNAFDLVMGCTDCGGAGEMPVPKTYMTCPCCRGREKFRPCKRCNGKGVTDEI